MVNRVCSYGGRSKLPDNLKQLFRPVVMTVPDNELIAEVILYSVGYTVAKELGSKVLFCPFNLHLNDIMTDGESVLAL